MAFYRDESIDLVSQILAPCRDANLVCLADPDVFPRPPFLQPQEREVVRAEDFDSLLADFSCTSKVQHIVDFIDG